MVLMNFMTWILMSSVCHFDYNCDFKFVCHIVYCGQLCYIPILLSVNVDIV